MQGGGRTDNGASNKGAVLGDGRDQRMHYFWGVTPDREIIQEGEGQRSAWCGITSSLTSVVLDF